ncbi:SDR family oxidoreductase [Planctomicrobium sp. SH661]|uniref:SDR family oxidoreductase n=1 Tax=Planctomicrobium sp. SH661 TaxID=3448124 RepID=UPI003F5C7C0A
MHLLIIGCGYLGMRVARAGLAAGHTVTALTRDPQRGDAWQNEGIQSVLGDVLDPASLKALPPADLCLYAVGYDRSAPAGKRDVYVNGLRNVLTEIRDKVARVIYISSTSVYGQDAGELVNEGSPCVPITEGGQICLDAENLIREFGTSTTDDRRAVILRLSGIYGPGRLIARKEQLLNQQPVSGNPEAWLNLIHVDDAVQTIWKLANRPFPESLFLLSDQTPLKRSEFYSAMAQRIGAPPPVFEAGEHQSWNKRCDSSRVREVLSLKLQYPSALEALEELLADES